MLTSESLGSFPFRTIICHHGIDLRKVFFLSNPLGTKLQAPERVVICSLTDLTSSNNGLDANVYISMKISQKSSQDSWKSTRNHRSLGTLPGFMQILIGVCRLMGQGLFSQTHHVTASALVGSGGPRWVWPTEQNLILLTGKKLAGNCIFHLISEWFSFLVWTCLDWFCGWWSCMKTIGGLHRMQENKKTLEMERYSLFWGSRSLRLVDLVGLQHRYHTSSPCPYVFGKGIFTKKMLGRFWQTASRCSWVYETRWLFSMFFLQIG